MTEAEQDARCIISTRMIVARLDVAEIKPFDPSDVKVTLVEPGEPAALPPVVLLLPHDSKIPQIGEAVWLTLESSP